RIDAHFACNCARGALVVAGQQIGRQPQLLELRDSGNGGVFDGIAHGNDTRDIIIDPHNDGRPTGGFSTRESFSELAQVLFASASDAHAVAVDQAADAEAGLRCEFSCGGVLPSVFNDSLSDWMLGTSFYRSGIS